MSNRPDVEIAFDVVLHAGELDAEGGSRSDRYGRRRPLLIGLVAYVLATRLVLTTSGMPSR
jgi:hypothetical protein